MERSPYIPTGGNSLRSLLSSLPTRTGSSEPATEVPQHWPLPERPTADPGGAGLPRAVSGVEALRRAELWLRAASRGRYPRALDGAEAELEAHYKRKGDILVGPAAYAADLLDRGRILAIRIRGPEDSPLY